MKRVEHGSTVEVLPGVLYPLHAYRGDRDLVYTNIDLVDIFFGIVTYKEAAGLLYIVI